MGLWECQDWAKGKRLGIAHIECLGNVSVADLDRDDGAAVSAVMLESACRLLKDAAGWRWVEGICMICRAAIGAGHGMPPGRIRDSIVRGGERTLPRPSGTVGAREDLMLTHQKLTAISPPWGRASLCDPFSAASH